MVNPQDAFAGALLGMAVGDAMGLPREGLSRRRARRMCGSGPLSHRFLLKHGMISDDAEHAYMTAQALLASGGDPKAFAQSLSWRLRGWLFAIPAGVGSATLRAILKLWIGFPPHRSGVKSAGNGPAMRAPILGLWISAARLPDVETLALGRASTIITHTDPRAVEGALVIAITTSRVLGTGGNFDPREVLHLAQRYVTGEELRAALSIMPEFLGRGASTEEFAGALGLTKGVSGYINHTVPVALYCCLRWPMDFAQAITDAVEIGGDTDTIAAIVGGIAGSSLGQSAIPAAWIAGLWEWPRSIRWMRSLSQRLAHRAAHSHCRTPPLPLFWLALPLRNALFALVVLTHGLRRLLPPY